MPRRPQYDEDDDDQDSLDEWETDGSPEDQEPDLVPCPYCHKMIIDDAVRCPKCGNYIGEEDAPSKRPIWIIVTAILLLLACLLTLLY